MAGSSRRGSGAPRGGDSLRRVQKSARSEWARGRRDAVRSAIWWAIPLCVVGGVAAATITHRAYFGYGFAALALLAMADIALTKPPGLGEAGRRAAGEAATAKAFRPLRFLGYTVLHDRRLPPNRTPGAPQVDVEHLLIGPGRGVPAGLQELGLRAQGAVRREGPVARAGEPGADPGPGHAESRALTAALGSPAGRGDGAAGPGGPHQGLPADAPLLEGGPDPAAAPVRPGFPGHAAGDGRSQAQSLAVTLDRVLAPRTGDRFTAGRRRRQLAAVSWRASHVPLAHAA